MQRVMVQLHPNGVAAPAQVAATTAMHVVSHFLQHLDDADLAAPTSATHSIGYRFSFNEMSRDQLKQLYQNWLLSKGFQGLAQGVRESLEEAYLYVRLAEMKSAKTTWGHFQESVASVRRRATKRNFPQLLAEVNTGLREPLHFEAEFLSMQKARNCLEHRRGIVSDDDLESGCNSLILSFPRLKIFYKRDDHEIEVVPGEVIDTHNVVSPHERNNGAAGTEIPIFLRREIRRVSFALGDRITFSIQEFNEIAAACHFFAADLAGKLPVLPPPLDTAAEDASKE
ncbi:hypothetical protein [Methylocystis sp.]|uniref:hypothetical protein n=1 Tax=Methylocystis sp. TaxID=1911079 RepID=UPI0025EF8EB6|nr:hypothetical protein [Methylocystis sp.]